MLRINRATSIETLLRDCRKGKASAQRELYEMFASKMLGVCVRYITERAEAEHIMIGGMVKMFEKLEHYQRKGSLEGWVRKIMVNECLMYIRKLRVMALEVELVEKDLTLDFAVLDSTLETQDLLEMIATLPIGYRTVFNLYAIEGFSHKEIAIMLDINENTSKSQLSRARKLLQQKLSLAEDLEQKKYIEHGTIK